MRGVRNTVVALNFRKANEADLSVIVRMLADDNLGQTREYVAEPLPQAYVDAFKKINANPQAHLYIAECDGQLVAVAQIDYLQYLTYQGGKRAQIEGVRVHKDFRSQGVGQLLFEYLIAQAKQHGCHMLQLTTNLQRNSAHKFYQRLGFIHSHAGFKLELNNLD